MTLRFDRYELRTTDADAAREFYSKLLGHNRAIVWPLHEQARARGAMPHWLGSIGVGDLPNLEQITGELVARGATPLGPVRPAGDGRHAAVLRDPGGAILGLTTGLAGESAPTVEVAWHVLNTNQLDDAIANYRTLFGWTIADEPLTGPYGAFHEFGWDTARIGAMADVAGRAGVHPHWLFFFSVPSVDDAVAVTREAGGSATEPIATPAGTRIAICEDPQGAAFGVLER